MTRRQALGLTLAGGASAIAAIAASRMGYAPESDVALNVRGENDIVVPDAASFVRPRDVVARNLDAGAMGVTVAPVGAVGASALPEVYDVCHLVHTQTLFVDAGLVPEGVGITEMWDDPDMGPYAVLAQYEGITTTYGVDGCDRYAVLFDPSSLCGTNGELADVVCGYDNDFAEVIDCEFDVDAGIAYVPVSAFDDGSGRECGVMLRLQMMVRIDCANERPEGYVHVEVEGDIPDGAKKDAYVPYRTFDTSFAFALAAPGSALGANNLVVYLNDMDLGMMVDGEYASFDPASGIMRLAFSPSTLTCVRIHVAAAPGSAILGTIVPARAAYAAVSPGTMRIYKWSKVDIDDEVKRAARQCKRFTYNGVCVSMNKPERRFTGVAEKVRKYIAKNFGALAWYVYGLNMLGYGNPDWNDPKDRGPYAAQWLSENAPGQAWWNGDDLAPVNWTTSLSNNFLKRVRASGAKINGHRGDDITQSDFQEFMDGCTWDELIDTLENKSTNDYWNSPDTDGKSNGSNILRMGGNTLMLPSSDDASEISGFKNKEWFQGIKNVNNKTTVVAIPAVCAHFATTAADNSVYTGQFVGHVLEYVESDDALLIGFSTGQRYGAYAENYGSEWTQGAFAILKVAADKKGLTLTKVVTGDGASSTRKFTFHLTIWNAARTRVVYSDDNIVLTGGDTYVVPDTVDLQEGMHWEFTEEPDEYYVPEWEGRTGTIGSDGMGVATCTNDRKQGKLRIVKRTSGIDSGETFSFKLSVYNVSGKLFDTETFTLRSGEHRDFTYPSGHTYTVVETNVPNDVKVSYSKATGTFVWNYTETCTVTNTRSGFLRVDKGLEL